MSFIFAMTPGMHAAAATNAGLAAETGGASGTASAAGAVLPLGSDAEVSPLNVAKIEAYVAEAVAVLANAATYQGLYSATVTTAAVGYGVTDVASAAPFDAI